MCQTVNIYELFHRLEPFIITNVKLWNIISLFMKMKQENICIKPSKDGVACTFLQWFVIYFRLANKILFLLHVFKTMLCQALIMFESFAAIIALESLLLGVGHFVALQITSWSKTAVALVTLVWLFSSVYNPRVDCQFACCDAWKVTLWTFLRLFSRVGHFVQPHICQLNWRISTLIALIRLYPSVYHNVSF